MKHRALQILHQGIVRFWVHPLESKLIPRLESSQQTPFGSLSLRWASGFANLGRIVVLNLRVKVVRWVGDDWTVTYIGEGESIEAINILPFQETPNSVELPKVYLWQVAGLLRKYTVEGDLVVCELNEILN